ncbi:hypothetical protein, partial [uncultured Algoriphagus sp.]|uniref:hypothetical protein n=1 Tax=uncultured Algoriphagus sp. TaxID=417365 RepID=UPI0025915E09
NWRAKSCGCRRRSGFGRGRRGWGGIGENSFSKTAIDALHSLLALNYDLFILFYGFIRRKVLGKSADTLSVVMIMVDNRTSK